MSLYIILFHIGFIIMTFFDENNYPSIFHHTGILITILLFVGGLHETLFLIFQLSIYIVFFFKRLYLFLTRSENKIAPITINNMNIE
jgi:uncharacterized membrane protein